MINQRHLKVKLSQNGGNVLEAIAFDMAAHHPLDGTLDVALGTRISHYQGRTSLDLRLLDRANPEIRSGPLPSPPPHNQENLIRRRLTPSGGQVYLHNRGLSRKKSCHRPCLDSPTPTPNAAQRRVRFTHQKMAPDTRPTGLAPFPTPGTFSSPLVTKPVAITVWRKSPNVGGLKTRPYSEGYSWGWPILRPWTV